MRSVIENAVIGADGDSSEPEAPANGGMRMSAAAMPQVQKMILQSLADTAPEENL
jgi:hypothetical protein